MSRRVASLVYSRKCGSMARKAVLAYFAERANDDGSGIWASKQRVADEIECSKQTVIRAVQGMLEDGLIYVAGRRKTQGGHTVIYNINLAAVDALEPTKAEDGEIEVGLNQSHGGTGNTADQSHSDTPTSHTELPKPSKNRPNNNSKRALPANWEPAEFSEGSVSRKVVDAWPPGKLRTQLERFCAHHTAAGNKFSNWQAAWSKWVLNDKEFSNGGRLQQGSGKGADRRSGLARAIDSELQNLSAFP